jgi:NADH dehydrogenase FAD-containing subunit
MFCPQYLMAECKEIDVPNKKITCYDKYHYVPMQIEYDYLVIAVGAVPNDFGIPGVKEYCHFLRQIQDARMIRKNLIECFEMASSPLTTLDEKKKLLSFVIVGGGPTSCEFSAELHDFLETDFRRGFPQIKIDDVKIILIESTDHLLGMFDRKLSDYAEKYFKRGGIKIMTNTRVKEVKQQEIILHDNTIIPYGMCVWSTGNAPNPFIKSLNFEKDTRSGRLLVDQHLKLKNIDDIYAIGDCATQENSNLPQTAQCAQQEGAYLAKMFKKIQKGSLTEEIESFKYIHFGLMSYIGGYQAIVNFSSGQTARGYIAWLFWRSAYFTRLLSVRNKFLVPMYWFKAFVFGRDISSF